MLLPASAIGSLPSLLTLLSLFLFYVFNNAIWAYLDRIGVQAGIATATLGFGLGLSMLAGIAGGAIAYFLGERFGRVLPFVLGLLSMAWGAWALTGTFGVPVYFVAAAVFNAALAYVVSYYLGYCAELDATGRTVILANFAIAAGLAAGPALGATLVTGADYDRLLLISAAGFFGCLVIGVAGVLAGARRVSVRLP